MTLIADLTGARPLWSAPELKAWRRAAVQTLAEVDPTMAAPPGGDRMLREALAHIVPAAADRIMITSGVRASVGPLLRDCAEVVIERPTFAGVVHAIRRERVPVRAESWERMVRPQPSGTALWFTAPCRNPDGRCADEAFLTAMTAAAESGHRVVGNTAYQWFAPSPPLTTAVSWTGTLHKLAGRGARLGWVVADPADEDLLHGLALTAPPLLTQRTWGRFLAGGGADLLRQGHQELRAAVAAFFAALGPAGPDGDRQGPNFLIPVPVDDAEAVTRLAEAGVRVAPGSAFDAVEPSVRVTLAHVPPEIAGAAGDLVARVLTAMSAGNSPGRRRRAGQDAAG